VAEMAASPFALIYYENAIISPGSITVRLIRRITGSQRASAKYCRLRNRVVHELQQAKAN